MQPLDPQYNSMLNSAQTTNAGDAILSIIIKHICTECQCLVLRCRISDGIVASTARYSSPDNKYNSRNKEKNSHYDEMPKFEFLPIFNKRILVAMARNSTAQVKKKKKKRSPNWHSGERI